MKVLSPEQTEQLLDEASNKKLKYEFTCRVLAKTGLRVSEFCHLRDDPKWVDLQNNKIKVPESDEYYDDWGLNTEPSAGPKTMASVRSIPININNALYRVIDDFFKYNKGVKVNRQSVYRRVQKVATDAGIKTEFKVGPHVLRRTYASDLARAGYSASEIQALLGHADLSTSAKYVKIYGDDLVEKAKTNKI